VKIFKFFRQKLWVKVLFPILIAQLIVLSVIIGVNIQRQNKTQAQISAHDGENLALAVEGGMIDALAVGDNEIVVKQFERLKEKVAGLDVTIFDFNGDVTFSSNARYVGRNIAQYLNSKTIANQASVMLKTGQAPKQSFKERIDSIRYMSIFKPILNDSRCFHCHGRSRKVLGGMHVRTSIEKALLSSESTRNISILGGILGAALLGLIVYALFHKLVNKAVQRLLDLGGKMREGDLTCQVEVKGFDEISHMSARMNMVNATLKKMIREISNSSHSLSEDSASQAASLEETTASVNQMATMIKNNVDHTHQADELMEAAGQVFVKSKDAMAEVTEAMTAISSASQETSKIIKTIDEIAFQTNLLALNASVEAARAGEAGAGFAVVADEVRNLALRAADAARNTSDLIEQTVNKIEVGSQRVQVTNEHFSDLSSKIDAFSRLIHEIADASGEQLQGISQINKAVTLIDDSTQQNSVLAERLAKAADRFKIDDAPIPQTHTSGDIWAKDPNRGRHSQYHNTNHTSTAQEMMPGRKRLELPEP
jgi:methyl-accepting chemotaxis protein